MQTERISRSRRHHQASGFTLMEVVMCLVIMGMLFSGMLLGYVASAKRTEWSGYSLAAQALAIQQLEQARSAKWDVISIPSINEITNIPRVTWSNMDIPYSVPTQDRTTPGQRILSPLRRSRLQPIRRCPCTW